MAQQFRGWYHSGAVPHNDAPGALQFVTLRLADSLPQTTLAAMERELARTSLTQRRSRKVQLLEYWLDQGLGCCILGEPKVAAAILDVLLHHHDRDYRLLAWCIMPNHLHLLVEPRQPLGRIVQRWKSLTTRWVRQEGANAGLEVPEGPLWRRDYWDRFIRDERHLEAVIHYIHQNPVKAGLAPTAEAWPWSSAGAKVPQA